jgi:hypothetical protein
MDLDGGLKMSMPDGGAPVPVTTSAPPQPSKPASSGPLVSAPEGALAVNEDSMKATVRAVLGTANEIGSFWNQWGVSTGLFILGTFAIIVAFIVHAVKANLWDDNSFFGSLAFALAILILGFIAFVDKQNRSGQTGQQAVEIYKTAVNASLKGQQIAADERTAALKHIPSNPPSNGGTPP